MFGNFDLELLRIKSFDLEFVVFDKEETYSTGSIGQQRQQQRKEKVRRFVLLYPSDLHLVPTNGIQSRSNV